PRLLDERDQVCGQFVRQRLIVSMPRPEQSVELLDPRDPLFCKQAVYDAIGCCVPDVLGGQRQQVAAGDRAVGGPRPRRRGGSERADRTEDAERATGLQNSSPAELLHDDPWTVATLIVRTVALSQIGR